jgi:hypothetical protein
MLPSPVFSPSSIFGSSYQVIAYEELANVKVSWLLRLSGVRRERGEIRP